MSSPVCKTQLLACFLVTNLNDRFKSDTRYKKRNGTELIENLKKPKHRYTKRYRYRYRGTTATADTAKSTLVCQLKQHRFERKRIWISKAHEKNKSYNSEYKFSYMCV